MSFYRAKLESSLTIYLFYFSCLALDANGTSYCEWNYNGLGIDYQVILSFEVFGILQLKEYFSSISRSWLVPHLFWYSPFAVSSWDLLPTNITESKC